MRLLANPVFMRMGLGILISMAAFAAAILGIRALRRELVDAESLPESPASSDPTFAYSAVIQSLKQQKYELQNEHATQARRARTSEQITAAVIANLPCGVLFLGPNGLVKQANAAARQLLGFASPLGMNPDTLFRDSVAVPESGEPMPLADAVKTSLRDRVRASFQSAYHTVTGEERSLGLTLIPLSIDEASALACVIADNTRAAQLSREKLLQKELSAEMALQLRSSLSVVRDCATRLADPGRQNSADLVCDIATEIDRLDRVVGGFLAESSVRKAASAGA